MASWREIERIRKSPDDFRRLAHSLLASAGDLTEWESDFLESVTRRAAQRRFDLPECYSLRQSEKLLEIRDGRIPVDTVRGFSVVTLVKKCYEARLDLSEDDEIWIAALHAARAFAIKRRDASRLLRLAEQLCIIDPVSA